LRLGPDLREIGLSQTAPLGLGLPHMAPSKRIIVLNARNIWHVTFLYYLKVNSPSIT
jgi:hypothetical protein